MLTGRRPNPTLACVAVAILSLALFAGPRALASKPPTEAIQAQTEIPEGQLVDVGIQIFNPGLPEGDENSLEERGIYADVRRAEARFIPFHLKNTLEATGQWGAVRVVPPGVATTGVTVTGTIVLATGMALVLDLHVEDAAGRVWRDRRYKERTEARAYADDQVEVRDPYQDLYNRVANDLVAARDRLNSKHIRELQELSHLKFAADIAPAAFDGYLSTSKKGRHAIEKLPAADDPMMGRVARVRERDHMFVDTLNEYYADFYLRMSEPYQDWRQFSFQEQSALREMRREARIKKIMGGLLIVGAVVGDGASTGAEVAREAATVGGAVLLKSGIEQGKEAKIHRAALQELAASFDAEITPALIEVEGQTLRLEGSAETQYAEWRRMLNNIFATETGLEHGPDSDSRPSAAPTTEH